MPRVPDFVSTLTAARPGMRPVPTLDTVEPGSNAVTPHHDQARPSGCLPVQA